MEKLCVLLFLFGTVLVAAEREFFEQEFIERINAKNSTWKAGQNFQSFSGAEKFVRGLMGVHPDSRYHAPPTLRRPSAVAEKNIPKFFDGRQVWKHCPTLNDIRDQGSCGSCWAFGAVECMSDRICIHSNGQQIVRLSPEDLLTCCNNCGYGCDGGYPGAAWNYWVNHGIVTGGEYHTKEGCQPYFFIPCGHDPASPGQTCNVYQKTPQCNRRCIPEYSRTYRQDLYYGRNAYSVDSAENRIQEEIMTNGPVEAAFTVYADFMQYKSGVYQHILGDELGGHAVKIIGWGEENGIKYWLVANSWNVYWGDRGFFKMLRGTDECGFESEIVAGIPRL